jgi:putative oxidoreductase
LPGALFIFAGLSVDGFGIAFAWRVANSNKLATRHANKVSNGCQNSCCAFVRDAAAESAGWWRKGASMKRLLVTSNDEVLTLMRLVLGIVFFLHGAQKVLGWFGGFGFSGTMHAFTGMMHIPAPFAFLAIMAEFLGGIGLIVGLLARVAAFGIAMNMIVAVAMVHFANGPFMNWYGNQKGEGYEYHLLAIVIAVTIMIRGAGAFSVDHAITSKGA